MDTLYDRNGTPNWALGFDPAWKTYLVSGDEDALMGFLLTGAERDRLKADHPDIYAQIVTDAKVNMGRLRSREPRVRHLGKITLGTKPWNPGEQERYFASFKPSELQRLTEVPGMRERLAGVEGVTIDPEKPIAPQIEAAGNKKWLLLAILLGLPVLAAMGAAKA